MYIFKYMYSLYILWKILEDSVYNFESTDISKTPQKRVLKSLIS